MAFNRLKVHLWRYYRKHGNNDGYVLVADLHAYFDSVDHDCVYEQLSKVFRDDPKTLYLIMDFVDAFGEKSLGLGSQVSQIIAMFYPNKIDHYIKEVLKIEGYGRYNDDFVLIHSDKAYLQYCLDKINEMYNDLGIELNQNKTKICKLSSGFKFLKTKVHLTDTGRVVIRPDRKSIVRERRKLKKLKIKLDNGELEFEEVKQQYMSWRGYIKKFDSYKTLQDMDKLFNDLFILDWKQVERKKKRRKSYDVKYGEKQVQLADGTVLSLRLNGTEYESDAPIADEVLSEENLSNVTIDDVNKGKMKLNSKYPFGSGTRFSLREMTEDEKTIERLNAELTQTQVGLAEVFEMLVATS